MSSRLLLRFNGVLPDVDSEGANTSVSVQHEGFHLLIDAGNGVAKSLSEEAGSTISARPDAVLLTNSRKHHTRDLQNFSDAKIYCTTDCGRQVSARMPGVAKNISEISAGSPVNIGPFQVTPLAVDNAGDEPGVPGSVVYVIQAGAARIVAAWDFLRIVGGSQSVLWNPDVLILGTESYNDHPSTGMISVTEAYNLVRSWTAKNVFLVHYSGEKDRDDAKNQWHRGPTGPLSPDALQSAIDDHLRISDGEGKISITVARQGMTWSPPEMGSIEEVVGPKIEVDALDRHSFVIEKASDGKVVVTIEDSVSQLVNEFLNPRSDGRSLHAEGVKSMFMKGPELELVMTGDGVRIEIMKGKKAMFAKDMQVSERDSQRLQKYLQENFASIRAAPERTTAA